MKYCEDCAKCLVPDGGLQFARCGDGRAQKDQSDDRFVSSAFDVPAEHQYASIMRNDDIERKCGPDAKWFEPKIAEQVAA